MGSRSACDRCAPHGGLPPPSPNLLAPRFQKHVVNTALRPTPPCEVISMILNSLLADLRNEHPEWRRQ